MDRRIVSVLASTSHMSCNSGAVKGTCVNRLLIVLPDDGGTDNNIVHPDTLHINTTDTLPISQSRNKWHK